MIKEQVFVVRHPSPEFSFIVKTNGKLKEIAIAEIALDNNFFNILEDCEVQLKKISSGNIKLTLKIDKGYYEVSDLIRLIRQFNLNISHERIATNVKEKIELIFNKNTLKFSFINDLKDYAIIIPDTLKNFLCFSENIINPQKIVESTSHFTNSNSRMVLVKCNNLLGGEYINTYNKNSKVIFSYYLESDFGKVDKKIVKEPKFYETSYTNEDNVEFKINITDEFDNPINFVTDSNFYLKFLIRFETR